LERRVDQRGADDFGNEFVEGGNSLERVPSGFAVDLRESFKQPLAEDAVALDLDRFRASMHSCFLSVHQCRWRRRACDTFFVRTLPGRGIPPPGVFGHRSGD
jgi:hypothetical protein